MKLGPAVVQRTNDRRAILVMERPPIDEGREDVMQETDYADTLV